MNEENIVTPEVTPEVTPTTPPPVKEEIVVTEEDKERFFKAFLADEPYEEEMTLLKGRLKVKFRTLTLDENDVVFRQIEFDQKKGIARSDDPYIIKIVEYRLAGCLVSLNGLPFCEDITMETHPNNKDEGTTYLTERLKVMQKWQTFKLGAIQDAFTKFESRVRKLTEESFTENF